MNKEQKAAVVDRVADQIKESDTIFAVDYRGISVKQAMELRAQLSEAGARFQIVKNRLTVRAADKAVIFRASGRDQENMRRVAVDLSKEQGKEIFIRLVDDASGGWGHINFDDFRFHLCPVCGESVRVRARRRGPPRQSALVQAPLGVEQPGASCDVEGGGRVDGAFGPAP